MHRAQARRGVRAARLGLRECQSMSARRRCTDQRSRSRAERIFQDPRKWCMTHMLGWRRGMASSPRGCTPHTTRGSTRTLKGSSLCGQASLRQLHSSWRHVPGGRLLGSTIRTTPSRPCMQVVPRCCVLQPLQGAVADTLGTHKWPRCVSACVWGVHLTWQDGACT